MQFSLTAPIISMVITPKLLMTNNVFLQYYEPRTAYIQIEMNFPSATGYMILFTD